jgi:hypothetical protein
MSDDKIQTQPVRHMIDQGVDVLCALLSNQEITARVQNLCAAKGGDPMVFLSDMAINQVETYYKQWTACRHPKIYDVKIENMDGSKTCPDCSARITMHPNAKPPTPPKPKIKIVPDTE